MTNKIWEKGTNDLSISQIQKEIYSEEQREAVRETVEAVANAALRAAIFAFKFSTSNSSALRSYFPRSSSFSSSSSYNSPIRKDYFSRWVEAKIFYNW